MVLLFDLLITINLIAGVLLFPYGVNFIWLILASRKWEDPFPSSFFTEVTLPKVTVQLPIYNESKVVGRLVRSVCSLDYPIHKLQILVLDDSIDETTKIAQRFVNEYSSKGFDIELIHRENRLGYKAGALQNGLQKSKGELIAIFDADFVVPSNFLTKTVHFFHTEEKIGMVQVRCDHINRNFSFLTRAIAQALDWHYFVEKVGRKNMGAYIAFTGSGGLWKKDAILEAGGWSSDTLAEDLDISFRAQLKGWEFLYLRNDTVTQEISPSISILAVQNKRWSKGITQCLRKNGKNLLKSNSSSRIVKIQGFLQMSIYFAPLLILCNLASMGLLILLGGFDVLLGSPWNSLFILNSVAMSLEFLASFLSYFVAGLRSKRPLWEIILSPPIFFIVSFGLLIPVALSAISGVIQKGGTFARTQKFSISPKRTFSLFKSFPSPKKDWPILEVSTGFLLIVAIIESIKNLPWSIGVISTFSSFILGIGALVFSELRGRIFSSDIF